MTSKTQKSNNKTIARTSAGFILGRAGFAKISAVEGLHVSAAMIQDLHNMDARGLSGDARRREVLRKYGHKQNKP